MQAARSFLFVPGDRLERFDKALASGADAVVLDLEDAVAPAAKAAARSAVQQWLAAQATGPRTVLRINDEASAFFADDLALLAALSAQPGAAPAAVMLPKAERAETLARVRAAAPGVALLPLVESARGVLASPTLAAAPGVLRLVFGTLDYALDMDLQGPLADTVGLDTPSALLALASRAAGIASPVAGVTPTLDDEPRLLADLARARAHGFGAKLCIHPRQVAAVHAAFAPTADELAWAQRVLQAATDAATQGQGAVQLDGKMIDKPVIERARRIAARG